MNRLATRKVLWRRVESEGRGGKMRRERRTKLRDGNGTLALAEFTRN